MRAQSIGIIIVSLLALISCNTKDEFSLGKFRIEIATVITEGSGSYSLLLDNGKSLWPAASDVRYMPKNSQRVFVNYTLLSNEYNGYDHLVKINDIWNILTKNIIDLTTENADSIGNDPIGVNGMWIGNHFLNIDFMFNFGGIKPHAINLVHNTTTTNTDEEIIELEFRHNSYESTSKRLIEGLVSFNLKPLQREDADSVIISVKVKEWDKEKTHKVVYKYNNLDIKNSFAETPVLVIASDEYY